jgi:UDP-N-acetylglucosamine 2-epimerase (non-hydrolysing)
LIDHNLEWLYRIAKEPKHIKRFYKNNVLFPIKLKKVALIGGIMKKIRVMSIFGTRPEAIKMAPLVKELEKREEIESIVCVTAQHREMLDQVLDTFAIVPDYDLDIMKQGQTLSEITTRAMNGVDEVIKSAKPDLVLVHGDTSTTFAGALAAFYNQIAIGHVEAGLRTDNKYSPYPEEMNRQMVDCMSDLYFAPTQMSRENLLKENIPDEKIFVTGNTAIDAMATTVKENYSHPELDWVGSDRLLLLTAHRRENLGEPMKNIFRAIRRVLDAVPDIKVIYPIHKNPLVREAADEIFASCDRVRLIEPLEVFDFHNFQNLSYLILSDSGGIQEEAPSLGKPVLVLRDTTERPEGIAAGTLKLVGTDEETIFNECLNLLNNRAEYEKMSHASNPYGDGQASRRIADAIISFFSSHRIEE